MWTLVTTPNNGASLVILVGNRPTFIKLAPLARELTRRGVRFRIIHSGQHHDAELSEIFFQELDLPKPDVQLTLQPDVPGLMIGAMLAGLEALFTQARPSGLVLFDDTNTTLAGTLAAARLGIRQAHIEAGPRTSQIDQPEEINRIIADRLAQLRFCADMRSLANLEAEGLGPGSYVTGDLVLDAWQHMSARGAPPVLPPGFAPGAFVLLTAHRAANTDTDAALAGLERLLGALDMPVILPLHPRTRAALKAAGRLDRILALDGVALLPPQGYAAMVALTKAAQVVVTDSGGLQREACFAGRRALVLDDTTPWPDLAAAGFVEVVGQLARLDPADVRAAIQVPAPPTGIGAVLGDGRAAANICDVLAREGWI